ncbi:MAG: flagellar filament capping protein FliD [Janthinobacterium lividum]
MSTSSTLSSVLSALGGTTGIDVTSAVDAILYADRAPERAWQAQQASLANQTSALNQLQSEASSLSDALSSLQGTTGALSAATTTSTNLGVVTATAVDGTPASSHQIVVTNLASSGSWYSAAESSSSAALPSGSFDITTGTTTRTITVGGTSGVDTLDQLEASINSSSLGLTASIVTDSSGARLSLVSTVSGTAADFSVGNNSTLSFTRADTGANAALTIDGVPVSSASNTVSGALNGVTLNLQSASVGTPITLSVTPDTTSIVSGVTSFISAYNTLITDVNSQLTYDSSTKTAGVLQADSAVQSLQSQLLNATNYNTGGSSFATLSALGITTNSDGTLSLNTATLNSAIQTNNAAVASFFQGTSSNGFVASVNTTLDTYNDPTQGAFTVDLQSIASENQDLTDQTSTLELYLVSQQSILTAQYNAADIAIQQLPQKLKQIQALLNPNQDSSSS